STRLCVPSETNRAYVTALAEDGGGVLGARVLAQSLRVAGSKGDIVVLVPYNMATAATLDVLKRDGLRVHVVQRGVQSGCGETVSAELMSKVFLWSLTEYDRVVFLDPWSLVQKSPDSLFTCQGFCAAAAPSRFLPRGGHRGGYRAKAGSPGAFEGEQQAMASSDGGLGRAHFAQRANLTEEGGGRAGAGAGEGTGSAPGKSAAVGGRMSSSVMVLEPSILVHQAMMDRLASYDWLGGLDPDSFLVDFLGLNVGGCPAFEDLEDIDPWTRESSESDVSVVGWTQKEGGFAVVADDEAGERLLGGRSGSGEGWVFRGAGGGGGRTEAEGEEGEEGLLDQELQPVLLLNPDFMRPCAQGMERSAPSVCHRLPYTYNAPSRDFHKHGSWGTRRHCLLCDQATEPKIIHFVEEDAPWDRLAYLRKPLFWKWNSVRDRLYDPYTTLFEPWLLFFIPCALLSMARVLYGQGGGGGGKPSGEGGEPRG
ncbi:unnamed protein product, partial [Discosporangium mesarthrocarpum]